MDIRYFLVITVLGKKIKDVEDFSQFFITAKLIEVEYFRQEREGPVAG
jgi:hypothetical protein